MNKSVDPTPSRIISSTQDLQKETEALYTSVMEVMQKADQKVEQKPDLDRLHEEGGSLIGKAFHEEEGAIREALEHYELTLMCCKVADHLGKDEKIELEAHLKKLGGLLDGVKDFAAKKFTKSRARLLTKFIWEEIAFLKGLSLDMVREDTSFLESLKQKFNPDQLKWYIEVYRQTMDELDEILAGPFKGEDAAELSLKKGRILEVKEDLLLGFTELKHLFSDKINHYFLATQEMRSLEDLRNQEVLDRIRSTLRPESSTIERVLEKTFTKKLISNPKMIGQVSLSLATTSHGIGKTATRALGSTTGLLTSAFSLPASAFSIYKIGHSLWRHREASRDIQECQQIYNNAKLMINQGSVMRKNAQRVIQIAPSTEEVALAKTTLEQGTRLMTVGSELREKADLNMRQLGNEKLRMQGQIFTFGTLTASQLALAAAGIGKMIQSLVSSLSTSGAVTALHWVGVAGAGLGVFLGTVNLGVHIKGLHGDQKELRQLALGSEKLDAIKLEGPMQDLLHDFKTVESHYHLRRYDELKISQRNHWISLASNSFMVVAGVLGIAAMVTAGVVSGGLMFAVMGVLLIGTVIAVVHFFKKREWLKDFDREAVRDFEEWNRFIKDMGRKIQWYGKDHPHMVEIMDILKIPSEKREAFFQAPEMFLKNRYQLIVEGRS